MFRVTAGQTEELPAIFGRDEMRRIPGDDFQPIRANNRVALNPNGYT